MHYLRIGTVTIGILVALLVPLSTSAQVGPFISFGGHVLSINYCTHGAVNIIILPAGGFPISYVWQAGIPVGLPPTHPGQQVLGLALPVPVPCIGFGTHPPVWWGLQVFYGGTDFSV